jgi:chorismate synthase
MLRFLTAGESHGQAPAAILDGMPAGVVVDFDALAEELMGRQGGCRRGQPIAIERSDICAVPTAAVSGDAMVAHAFHSRTGARFARA